MYEHRQRGTLILVVVATTTLLLLPAALTVEGDDPGGRAALVCAALLAAVSGWLFSSLTVRVDDRRLSWHFGPGFWRKSVALEEIEKAEAVRYSPLWGWGIRWTPRGWLYNVSGLHAVHFRLRSGRQFLLGTDQPEALVRAIGAARGATGA